MNYLPHLLFLSTMGRICLILQNVCGALIHRAEKGKEERREAHKTVLSLKDYTKGWKGALPAKALASAGTTFLFHLLKRFWAPLMWTLRIQQGQPPVTCSANFLVLL